MDNTTPFAYVTKVEDSDTKCYEWYIVYNYSNYDSAAMMPDELDVV